MTYMFRVRFKIGPRTRIDAKVDELVLDETDRVRIFLKSLTAGQLVSDADELAMRGEGYTTKAQALAAGKRWVGALALGTISEFVGTEGTAPGFVDSLIQRASARGRMLTMPTAYGAEVRQDDIYVARKDEAPLAQIANDFGLSVATLKRWIAIAERRDSGAGPAKLTPIE